ncbi:MAG: hypothetical protein ACNA7K_05745 [Acholeplasmataceae bacterium]
MNLIKDIITSSYRLHTHDKTADQAFLSVYQTDLLSRAIKCAQPQDILITIINHINTVATASMLFLSSVIICEDQIPTETMIKKANEADIALISTSLKSHEVIIDLYKRGYL